MKLNIKKIIFKSFLMMLPAWVFADNAEALKNAVIEKNTLAVERFIQQGMNPNIPYENGNTPLHLAAFEDSLPVINVLLKAAGVDIDRKNAHGETPLMIAALKGNKQMVDIFLARGAQINKPGWTALHYACSTGQDIIVAELLDKFAYIDAESPNKTTPLMMAARAGHLSTVTLLLKEGADPKLKNEQNLSAIDLAKKYNHQPVLSMLQSALNSQELPKSKDAVAANPPSTKPSGSQRPMRSQSKVESMTVPTAPTGEKLLIDKPWLR